MQDIKMLLDLQLFAEGGDGGADGGDAGANGQAAADQTGEQQEQDAAAERKAQYQKFKEDFKDDFDAEVQGIINNRLKKAKVFEAGAREYRDKTAAVFEALAVKYGIDPNDVDSIVAAVQDDDSYYADEALERGMEVNDFRHLKQMERENQQAREERAMREQMDQWYRQADEARQVYPQFDLSAEMQNDEFRYLAQKGVPLKTVYEIVHKDDVIAAAMKYASDQTAQKMQLSAQQNAQRPDENVRAGGGAVKTGADPGKMNLSQLEEVFARARRGERITF